MFQPNPKGANYYPPDATREDIAEWINGLSGNRRVAATSYFTTIRRGGDGQFMTVPYSLEYQGPLTIAAAHLRESRTAYVRPDATPAISSCGPEAFVTNDYYESDVAWMELDSAIELVIGPYEVYEDEWFNYKAAFEAFVAVRDDTETAQLERFSGYLQELEDNLPIDGEFRDPKLGALAPIRVVNVVCYGRRCEQRRPDSGIQPPQRRARGP